MVERQSVSGLDGVTEAFFCQKWYLSKGRVTVTKNEHSQYVSSTGYQRAILQSKRPHSILNRLRRKSSCGKQLQRKHRASKPKNPRTHRAIAERQIGATIGLDSSVLKCVARRAVWTKTFHTGGDGTTEHQHVRDKHSRSKNLL